MDIIVASYIDPIEAQIARGLLAAEGMSAAASADDADIVLLNTCHIRDRAVQKVYTELGKLRAGGRTVGVVSHVEAMKSAIADRISVRRTSDGSSRITVLAGA